MAKTTVAEVDKKVAVLEQALIDHQRSCESLSIETLGRVKRLEYLIGSSAVGIISLLLAILFDL